MAVANTLACDMTTIMTVKSFTVQAHTTNNTRPGNYTRMRDHSSPDHHIPTIDEMAVGVRFVDETPCCHEYHTGTVFTTFRFLLYLRMGKIS
jgi:hypothetical protein